ncbi:MAG: Gmad2 immunoglobulin-like domain-containing protein [Acidimicrobiia bacterium]
MAFGTTARRVAIVAPVVALLIGGIALALWIQDSDEVTSGPSTTTSTTPTSTTSTTAPRPGGPISIDEAATVVWPDPGGTRRFTSPSDAARSFTVDLLGFDDPVLGAFQQGDNRSGEVEVQPRQDGPVTTLFVRRLSDDSWWVLGAATRAIELTAPIPLSAIDNPLELAGRASAFEGTVQVSVFARGSTDPLGEGFVTGSGGPELGPFHDYVTWANPGGGWGSVVLYTVSARDGSVEQAVAIPVGFIGGD